MSPSIAACSKPEPGRRSLRIRDNPSSSALPSEEQHGMKTAGDVAHAPAPAGPGAPADQFFIPAATSLQERRTRTLKHGDSFGVFDPNGDSVAGPGSPEGLYHRDTRHLSHFLITIDGQRPMLLSSTLRDDNAMLTCDLTNPDLYDATG